MGDRPRNQYQPGARSRGRRCALLLTLAAALAGCQSAPPADVPRVAQRIPPPIAPIEEAPPVEGDAGILPAELNSARAAAMTVATRAPVADAVTRLEIALHAALYRAAWESNIAEMTSHYLLEPAREEAGATVPPRAVDLGEFRLRVLAALAELKVPIAFAQPPVTDSDFFPGTRELATRLEIRILSRDPAQATVIAEIGDRTTHVGASRQRVTAVWDGAEWVLDRDRARLIW